jgi:hypothetical protein
MKQIDKVDRYDWVKPGDFGRQCKIAVNILKIDHSYQRAEVSKPNTLALARAFNWVAFNSLVVMERANGDKYVVDGQQRLLAARHRGDIKDVPCVLFKSDGRDHEAVAFISLNIRRSHVPAVAKFRASVSAGIEPEKEIHRFLEGIGLEVMEDGKSMKGLCFPNNLIQTWNINCECSKKAVIIQREINGIEPLVSSCHRGIFWLLCKGINVAEHVEKLKRLGGRTALMREIKAVEIESNMTTTNRLSGIAILRLINYRRRGSKITVESE